MGVRRYTDGDREDDDEDDGDGDEVDEDDDNNDNDDDDDDIGGEEKGTSAEDEEAEGEVEASWSVVTPHSQTPSADGPYSSHPPSSIYVPVLDMTPFTPRAGYSSVPSDVRTIADMEREASKRRCAVIDARNSNRYWMATGPKRVGNKIRNYDETAAVVRFKWSYLVGITRRNNYFLRGRGGGGSGGRGGQPNSNNPIGSLLSLLEQCRPQIPPPPPNPSSPLPYPPYR